jgi:carboxyl-terminal processing protease
MDLGVLKITIQQFFRVSGASTQREGVTPDIVLPDPAGPIETGERELEHAIAWSQIDPAPHDLWSTTWNKADLAKKSAARVSKTPVFGKISTLSQLLKTRRDDTRIPLQKTAFDARRKAQRAAVEAASPDLKNQPAAFSVTSIADPDAPEVKPQPGGKPDDRLSKWRDNLARDPWVDESLNILSDIK